MAQQVTGPGEHRDLIRAITEDFATRFVPGGTLVCVGDTAGISFDSDRLRTLGVRVDSHEKMPDVLLHDAERGWLVVVEAITGHGPVDNTRRAELKEILAGARPGIVYVTAFPTRAAMVPYLRDIAWHTDVWIADEPSYLIQFDGDRYFVPYETK